MKSEVASLRRLLAVKILTGILLLSAWYCDRMATSFEIEIRSLETSIAQISKLRGEINQNNRAIDDSRYVRKGDQPEREAIEALGRFHDIENIALSKLSSVSETRRELISPSDALSSMMLSKDTLGSYGTLLPKLHEYTVAALYLIAQQQRKAIASQSTLVKLFEYLYFIGSIMVLLAVYLRHRIDVSEARQESSTVLQKKTELEENSIAKAVDSDNSNARNAGNTSVSDNGPTKNPCE